MAGFLTRLARGLGAGLTSLGESGLKKQEEDIRQQRLEKLELMRQEFRTSERLEEQKFRTSEREAGEAYKTGERTATETAKAEEARLDRESREKVAGIQAGARSSSHYQVITKEKDEDGVETGSYTYLDKRSGKQYRYDHETDTIKEVGAGTPDDMSDEKIKEFDDAVSTFGRKWADKQAGVVSLDAWDFDKLPAKYRSEEKVVDLINDALQDIRRTYGLEEAQYILDMWQDISDPDVMFAELNAWLRRKKRIK